MGLDLSKAAIIDDSDLTKDLLSIEDIEAELHKKGLATFPKPKGHPKGLADIDINKMTNDEIASLHTSYIAYQAYLSTEVARTAVHKSSADRNLKMIVAKLKSTFHAQNVKEKEIAERVHLHPTYLEYEADYAQARYMHQILESYDRAYGKQAASLSRCIELRKMEMEGQRRVGNAGRAGFGRGSPPTRPHRRTAESKLPTITGKKKGARGK